MCKKGIRVCSGAAGSSIRLWSNRLNSFRGSEPRLSYFDVDNNSQTYLDVRAITAMYVRGGLADSRVFVWTSRANGLSACALGISFTL